LLLVDDSEAILAYERAVLSPYYELVTAANGQEALQRMRAALPVAVLLDLSMPVMSGEQALHAMQEDAALAQVPVIIVSSEPERADAALRAGAAAYLPKPIRAEALRAVVSRVVEAHQAAQRRGEVTTLWVGVGPKRVAFPLDSVRSVHLMPAVVAVTGAPAEVRGVIELRGETLCVLDLAPVLGVSHGVRRVDRKLLVLWVRPGVSVALDVDAVEGPILEANGEPVPLLDPARVWPGATLDALERWMSGVAAGASGRASP
jgi:CheY-like chemotaxis protein/chemotaxis signal transduction protein